MTNAVRCGFCLKPDHEKQDCPEVGVITIREESPPTIADDAEERRAHRFFQLRAWARGMWTDAKRAGFQFSPETLALQPEQDSFDP